MEVEKYEVHLFCNGCRNFFDELNNQFKIQLLKNLLPKKQRTIQRKDFLKIKLKQKVMNLFSSKHKRTNNDA
jgi:hypothetical protein